VGTVRIPAARAPFNTQVNGTNTLIVDNGGLAGTNTPLGSSFSMPVTPFDLSIAGAASVVPLDPLPLINNFNLAAGATLTASGVKTNLVLAVQNDANIAGNLTVDDLGYPQANGPGSGTTNANQGSGGGYGGTGGNSASGAIGGVTYGSATQPMDFGSGGGPGATTGIVGGSEGGGAIRLSVGGTLNIDGSISANGDYGWQDNAGGGAGGSIWVTASKLTGSGVIAAAGGDGDLWNGGGGGGGRIAIYAPNNLFTGVTNVDGGWGAYAGQTGTVFLATAPLAFAVASQSPSGIVSNTVSHVDLHFNEALNSPSVSASDFTITTPSGILPAESLGVTIVDPATVRVSFPVQNLIGDYSVQAATSVQDLFGLPLSSPYTGGFTVSLPAISGTVSDTNGAPVSGVQLQPDGGLIGTTTDANGHYILGVPPGWNGTVTPTFGTAMFIPGSMSYTSVSDSATNQNYLMVPTIAPAITAANLGATNLSLSWMGFSGVNYQIWYSTNLTDWRPYGGVITGTNGTLQVALPMDASPSVFFRLGAAQP
jgi:hypothetical protein